MGKILVEKLLRSCPGIETIYILVRTKRGVNQEERIKEYLNSPVINFTFTPCINLKYKFINLYVQVDFIKFSQNKLSRNF